MVKSLAVICCVCTVFLAAGARADLGGRVLEYKVKAAYLYNFTKFVDWPKDVLDPAAGQPLRICILGVDPFGHSIDLLANKTAHGHPVEIKYLQDMPFLKTPGECQVLFISQSESDRLDEILNAVSGLSILTVSDIGDFARNGGCIALLVVDGKVRFNINITAARQARLDVSAKLLELAKRVVE